VGSVVYLTGWEGGESAERRLPLSPSVSGDPESGREGKAIPSASTTCQQLEDRCRRCCKASIGPLIPSIGTGSEKRKNGETRVSQSDHARDRKFRNRRRRPVICCDVAGSPLPGPSHSPPSFPATDTFKLSSELPETSEGLPACAKPAAYPLAIRQIGNVHNSTNEASN